MKWILLVVAIAVILSFAVALVRRGGAGDRPGL